MNERIKKLADQAGFDLSIIMSAGYKPHFDKFAELLLTEFANHIAGQLPNERLDDWHEGYHAGVQSSIDCLKAFGVEE
jgi:hypothetical protein